MNHKTEILVAFAVGAAAGSVAALLLAPDKGENTRRKLKEGAEHMLKETKEKVGGTADDVRNTLKTQGKAVREAVQTARDTYRHELERAHEETPA